MMRRRFLQLATLAFGLVPATISAAGAQILTPLSDHESYVDGEDEIDRFESGDDVYVLIDGEMVLRSTGGLQRCKGFGAPQQSVTCGDVTASLTATGDEQSLPQLGEQYNHRSGRPATLSITRGHERQVLNGWWVVYQHSN